jgi:hypothetical protein
VTSTNWLKRFPGGIFVSGSSAADYRRLFGELPSQTFNG